MKRTMIALIASTGLLTASMAFADDSAYIQAGCTAKGLATFVDEYTDADGVRQNCPASNWENTTGDVGKFLLAVGIGAAVLDLTGAANVFPVSGL